MGLTVSSGDDFELMFKHLQRRLIEAPLVATGEWQSQNIEDKPMLATRELMNVSFIMAIPSTPDLLAQAVGAHLPWAEDHFQERVGGEPLNPSPSEAWWPFAQQGNKDHKSQGEAFSHTYPERMWPKHAGNEDDQAWDIDSPTGRAHRGIRFAYGDLGDVVDQLDRGPLTRQAFLPIWFPEDTGAVHRERVPCSIGYHFMIRGDKLQVTYYMRSCDFIRHFQDDVYMAARLAQWMCNQLNDRRGQVKYRPSDLIMHIVSLHCFEGDMAAMEYRDSKDIAWDA